jgi:hypothetical protein
MNDAELRTHLTTIYTLLQEYQDDLAESKHELEAIKDVLKEANPKFNEAYMRRLDFWRTRTSSLGVEKIPFDDIIEKLKSS